MITTGRTTLWWQRIRKAGYVRQTPFDWAGSAPTNGVSRVNASTPEGTQDHCTRASALA